VRFPTLFVSIASCGCQLVAGYEEFDYVRSAPEPGHACETLPTAKDDDRGLAVMARVDLKDQTCLWMDRTEVTVEQYRGWQDEVPANGVEWEPTWCDWKGDRANPVGDPDDACVSELLPLDLQPFAARKPMRCVDFCEAEAFCRWAGKHLCYDAAGLGVQGPRGFPQEWLLACTNQMTTRYPWGTDTKDVCNTGQDAEACLGASGTCGPVTVGQKSDCSTPRGVVDLLGNVSEWVFSCNFVDSTRPLEPSPCLTRGGGYDAALQACDIESTIAGDARQPSLGFRCCANLTSAEELLVRSTRQ
jgi:formylglycine-generating enzyme required for sulfatase activity